MLLYIAISQHTIEGNPEVAHPLTNLQLMSNLVMNPITSILGILNRQNTTKSLRKLLFTCTYAIGAFSLYDLAYCGMPAAARI